MVIYLFEKCSGEGYEVGRVKRAEVKDFFFLPMTKEKSGSESATRHIDYCEAENATLSLRC